MRRALVSYTFILVLLSACGQDKPTGQSRPDAVRDLLIDRVVWRSTTVLNRPGVQEDEHRFTLTNTSDRYRYNQIQLRVDYFNKGYQRVATKRYTLNQTIEAGTAVAIAPIRLGQTHPLAKSADVRVEDGLVY